MHVTWTKKYGVRQLLFERRKKMESDELNIPPIDTSLV